MPKQKNLTPKERQVIKLICSGETQTNAVFATYNCSTKASAGAMATKIMKRPQVIKVLNKGLEVSEGKIVQNIEKSLGQELAMAGIDRKAIVEKFKELLFSDDKRVVQGMLDLYSKWQGLFAPEKRMLIEQSTIYQEIKQLPEEGIIEEQKELEEGPEETNEKPATKE